ncbi:MAG: biotin--[acetyl-CoA-carboxylase] ligase [Planctomycetes bacterium]|nr:biotin--[acetyl-CoA-carboxylase] ligase [Planctomycetota bacterium]
MLDRSRIQPGTVGLVGRRILTFEECGSTNDIAFDLLTNEGAAAAGTVIFADHQTAGRGRRGRVWHSRPGLGILCSIALRAEPAPPAPSLVAGCAVAVRAAILELLQIDARIKWPNDLLINNKKTCGILVEARLQGKGANIVAGIGVNLNQDPAIDFAEEVRSLATSLAAQRGAPVNREAFASCMIARLDDALPRALVGDFGWIESRFFDGLRLGDRRVIVENSTGARAAGILRRFSCVRGVELEDEHSGARTWHAAETIAAVTANEIDAAE